MTRKAVKMVSAVQEPATLLQCWSDFAFDIDQCGLPMIPAQTDEDHQR